MPVAEPLSRRCQSGMPEAWETLYLVVVLPEGVMVEQTLLLCCVRVGCLMRGVQVAEILAACPPRRVVLRMRKGILDMRLSGISGGCNEAV